MYYPHCFTILLLLAGALSASFVADSPVTCDNGNDVACDIHENNLVGSFGGVASLAECRQLCLDSQDCQYLTYYPHDSFPYQRLCYLFNSCNETHNCSSCFSEGRECQFFCGEKVIGGIEDNFLEAHGDVKTELECKDLCKSSSNCSFYTYFMETDPNSKVCILMTFLIQPLTPCETCKTGPVDCNSYQCTFDGLESLMFTDPDLEVNVTVSQSLVRDCHVRILAVGGGGETPDGCGGGGSGYIRYIDTRINGSSTISVKVGEVGRLSAVTIDGERIVASAGGSDLPVCYDNNNVSFQSQK